MPSSCCRVGDKPSTQKMDIGVMKNSLCRCPFGARGMIHPGVGKLLCEANHMVSQGLRRSLCINPKGVLVSA